MLITTREKADQHFEVRAYNVRRLTPLSPKELAEIIVGTVETDRWHPITRPISVATTNGTAATSDEGKNRAIPTPGGTARTAEPAKQLGGGFSNVDRESEWAAEDL